MIISLVKASKWFSFQSITGADLLCSVTKSSRPVCDAGKLADNALATKLRASWTKVQQFDNCTGRTKKEKALLIGDRPHRQRLLPVVDPSTPRLLSI